MSEVRGGLNTLNYFCSGIQTLPAFGHLPLKREGVILRSNLGFTQLLTPLLFKEGAGGGSKLPSFFKEGKDRTRVRSGVVLNSPPFKIGKSQLRNIGVVVSYKPFRPSATPSEWPGRAGSP